MIDKSNYKFYLVGFLTICCSLYQILYWYKFGLNAFEVLSVSGLFYRSYQSILYALGVTTVLNYILKKYVAKHLDKKFEFSKNSLFEFAKYIFTIIIIFIAIAFKAPYSLIIPFAAIVILIPFIDIDVLFNKDFGSIAEKNISVSIALAILSLISVNALEDADKILHNEEYMYATIVQKNAINNYLKYDTIKLIGITDKTFVFSSLNNKYIRFINSDDISLMEK